MSATEELRIVISTQSKGQGAQQTSKGLRSIADAAKFAVGAFAALKGAQAAVDFVKQGAAVQRQANALDNLAKSAGTSGAAITQSIQRASDYTIDRMTAMEAASKAMIMGVAESPEQFERLTKVATTLGRAMGQDATKSIDDFVIAAFGQDSRGFYHVLEPVCQTHRSEVNRCEPVLQSEPLALRRAVNIRAEQVQVAGIRDYRNFLCRHSRADDTFFHAG